MEYRRFLEEVHSDHVKLYFDVGNTMLCGFPEDWIEYLAEYICQFHVRDFDKNINTLYGWRNIFQGHINAGSVAFSLPAGRTAQYNQQCAGTPAGDAAGRVTGSFHPANRHLIYRDFLAGAASYEVIQGRASRSIFSPERITPTRRLRTRRPPSSRTATGTAAEGSSGRPGEASIPLDLLMLSRIAAHRRSD
jgi:hypothetical protein